MMKNPFHVIQLGLFVTLTAVAGLLVAHSGFATVPPDSASIETAAADAAPDDADMEAPQAPPDPGAAAKADAVETEKFGDWGMVCTKPEEGDAGQDCAIVQNALIKVETAEGEQPRRVMRSIVRYAESVDKPIFFVTVPLGVLLPAGVLLDIEGYDTVRMPLQRCDADGCMALHEMPEQLVDAFRKKSEAHVTFFDIKRKPSRLRVSLTGFTKAFATISSKRGD